MNRTVPAVLLASALALAGCTAAPAGTAAPDVSSVATPTPTPAPTAMATAEAGRQFLLAMCPSNKLVDRVNAAVTTRPLDVTETRAAHAAYRDALAGTVRALMSPPLPWPDSVKGDVSLLIDSLTQDIATADYVVQAGSQSDMQTTLNSEKPSTAGQHAQAIRVKLGLQSDARASCGMPPAS